MAGQTANYLFDYPTSTDYVKDGATAIETLADDVDATLFTALGGAYPGLRLVKKQTIGTGVTTVNVTGAFSATYENYKIIVSGGTPSGNGYMTLQMGAANSQYFMSRIGYNYSGSINTGFDNNNSIWTVGARLTTGGISANFDLKNPFAARWTFYDGSDSESGAGGILSGVLKDTTSYTAFTLTSNSPTLTGGTVYVYGYGIS